MIYIFITLLLAFVFWLSNEIRNAPLVDENENIIKPNKDEEMF